MVDSWVGAFHYGIITIELEAALPHGIVHKGILPILKGYDGLT